MDSKESYLIILNRQQLFESTDCNIIEFRRLKIPEFPDLVKENMIKLLKAHKILFRNIVDQLQQNGPQGVNYNQNFLKHIEDII